MPSGKRVAMSGRVGQNVVERKGSPKRTLTYKARNAEDTRERILRQAIKEFSAHGFPGARVERIVRNSDISMRMLYHYYENKESLYVAVLERVYQDAREAEQLFDVKSCGPKEGIRKLVDFTFTHFAQNPHLINLVMAENFQEARYLRRSDLIPSMSVKLQDAVSWIVAEGEKTGVFRRGVDPVQLWVTVFSLCWTHLSNRHTLSWMLQTDLSDPNWLEARRRHVQDVVIGFLRP